MVCRKAIDFCMLISYPPTLWNLLVWIVFEWDVGILCSQLYHLQTSTHYFFLVGCFLFFFLPVCSGKYSIGTMLHYSDKSRYSCRKRHHLYSNENEVSWVFHRWHLLCWDVFLVFNLFVWFFLSWRDLFQMFFVQLLNQ